MQKKMLTYEEAFLCASAFNDFYAEKMNGRIAAKLYRISKPFSHLKQDYEELVKKFDKPDDEDTELMEEYIKNISQINSSEFDEFEMISLDTLEELKISPLTIQKLEALILL